LLLLLLLELVVVVVAVVVELVADIFCFFAGGSSTTFAFNSCVVEQRVFVRSFLSFPSTASPPPLSYHWIILRIDSFLGSDAVCDPIEIRHRNLG
jgi:hypothetical protein